VIITEELCETFQVGGIPFDCFGTFAFRAQTERMTFCQANKVVAKSYHRTPFFNESGAQRGAVFGGFSENQGDLASELGPGRPCRSRTCDTLIKSHGVSNQARKEVKTALLTP